MKKKGNADIVNQSLKIVEWIKSHPLFKWGTMCKVVGIDKSNFSRTLQEENPKIKADVIVKMESILKEYGYK